MQFKWSYVLVSASVCTWFVACGGSTSTAPTPTDPPQIACPIAPDPVDSLDGSGQAVTFGTPTVTGGQAPLNTSCTPVSGATFPVGTSTVTCSTSDAKARTASCTFPVVVLPPPKLAVTSFIAFGDSITYGEDGTAAAAALALQRIFVQLPSNERYPDILQAEMQARYKQQTPMMKNDGYPGESLSDGLTPSGTDCSGGDPTQSGAFQRYARDITAAPYGGLLLMEGSNDVNESLGDSCLLGKATNVERAIIDDAKRRGIRVVLGTIPPMVPPGFNNRAEGYQVVPTFNDMVKTLGASESIPLADVYTAFGSDAPTLIGFDGLHPNAAGYQRIADTFFGTIKSSLEVQTASAKKTVLRHR